MLRLRPHHVVILVVAAGCAESVAIKPVTYVKIEDANATAASAKDAHSSKATPSTPPSTVVSESPVAATTTTGGSSTASLQPDSPVASMSASPAPPPPKGGGKASGRGPRAIGPAAEKDPPTPAASASAGGPLTNGPVADGRCFKAKNNCCGDVVGRRTAKKGCPAGSIPASECKGFNGRC